MKSFKNRVLFCVFLIGVIGHGVASMSWAQIRSESEPNDRKDQAQEIRFGDGIEGGFQIDYDNDWFKLSVGQAGKNYVQISLSGVPGINSELRLYDEKGNSLCEVNDGGNNSPETIAHFPLNAGTYYLLVYGGGKAAKDKYTLTTKITGLWQDGQEAEPNDGLKSANDLKLGQSVEGYFSAKNDYDYFKFVIDKPGIILVQFDLSAVPQVDSQLALREEKRGTIWRADETREGGQESIFSLALDQGVYFLEVNGRQANIDDKYVLTTKIINLWKPGMEAEPNNNLDQATELRLGQTAEGYFHFNNDVDYYRLIVDQPGKSNLQVELSGVPGVETRLEIADKEGRGLWSVNEASKGEPESAIYFTVTEGVYYLWIQGSQKNITDKYFLRTQLLGPLAENEEAEPNSSAKWASELRLNTPLTGRINVDRDTDYFVWSVQEPGMELVVMQVSSVPGIRWDLALLDAKENRVDYSGGMEPGKSGEIVKMKFRPGTYYLRLEVTGGKNRGAEYTLYAGKPQKPPATEEEVRQALLKALDFLAAKQQKNGSWSGYEQAYTGLSLMAFLGGKCVQKDYSANVRSAINYLQSVYRPSSKYPEGSKDAVYYGGQLGTDQMYQQAIATTALLEALVDLNDESLEPIAQDALNLIIRAQNTEYKPADLSGPVKPDSPDYGGWRYNPRSTDSDISVTGWQILTLKAAVNAGFSVPEHSFLAAAKYVRSLQGKKDGSFNYNSPGDKGNSCARAGMGALSLQLCGFPKDPAIPPALKFMQDWPPRWNVEQLGNGYPFYYWYYGTRAMYLSGGDDWRIWKDWMCRLLVDHQNEDGSWDGMDNEKNLDIYRVALGALMLEFCCGHVPIYMSPVKRLGPAYIKVDFEKGAEKELAKNVEIIMDASNSMWGQIGGEAKINIARKVLAQIISGLPDSMNVGLRVYGHRYGLNDKRACADTELLVPIGPVAKTQLIDTVNKIQLKGKTPLVLSVLEAIKDFEKIPNGSVILVTDGIESCNGDIKSIGPAIKKSGLELKVHIVGFDIKEKEARAELEAIAKSTDGMYLDAKDAAGLLSALEQTLQLEYVVLNTKGEIAGKGIVGGEAIKVAEGTYTLRVLLAPEPLEMKITLKPGDKPVYFLKKSEGKWSLK